MQTRKEQKIRNMLYYIPMKHLENDTCIYL